NYATTQQRNEATQSRETIRNATGTKLLSATTLIQTNYAVVAWPEGAVTERGRNLLRPPGVKQGEFQIRRLIQARAAAVAKACRSSHASALGGLLHRSFLVVRTNCASLKRGHEIISPRHSLQPRLGCDLYLVVSR